VDILRKLSRTDRKLVAWMENPDDDFMEAIAFCARQRRIYFAAGVAFSALVIAGSWFTLPAVYIPAFVCSIIFFVGSLYHDSYMKLLLLLRHGRGKL